MSDELKEKVIGTSDTAPAKSEPAKAKVLTISGAKDSLNVSATSDTTITGAKDTAPTGAKDGTLGAKD
jgi:hypothetical protein